MIVKASELSTLFESSYRGRCRYRNQNRNEYLRIVFIKTGNNSLRGPDLLYIAIE